MTSLLITGGLGQAGMAIAEVARKQGWTVTLVGRTPLAQKAAALRAWVQEKNCSYHALDIYAPADAPRLLALAATHHHWVQAAEPYQSTDLAGKDVQAMAMHTLQVAVQAGFATASDRRLLRIGSPVVEVMHDAAVARRKRTSGHFPEDVPLDGRYRLHPAFLTRYFKAKATFAVATRHVATTQGLKAITVCPTALVGPYGDKGAAYEGLLHVIRKDFPYRHYLPTTGVNALPLRHFAAETLQALQHGEVGACYQLAGHNLPTASLMAMALDAVQLPIPKLLGPTPPLWMSLPWVAAMGLPFHLLRKPKPWWLEADLHALLAMMQARSAQKATTAWGYEAPGREAVEVAVREAVDWYRTMGWV